MSKLGLITLVSPLTVALAVGCLQIRVLSIKRFNTND